jgi:hypothetical protein
MSMTMNMMRKKDKMTMIMMMRMKRNLRRPPKMGSLHHRNRKCLTLNYAKCSFNSSELNTSNTISTVIAIYGF